MLLCQLKLKEQRYTIANTYAPNDDEPLCFVQLFDKLEQFNLENLLLIGDFNLTLEMEKDKRFISYNNRKVSEAIKELMTEFFPVDIWRIKNPEAFQSTWKRESPSLAFARLDYFFIPQGVIGNVTETKILPSFRSDHCPIFIFLEVETSNFEEDRVCGNFMFHHQRT